MLFSKLTPYSYCKLDGAALKQWESIGNGSFDLNNPENRMSVMEQESKATYKSIILSIYLQF